MNRSTWISDPPCPVCGETALVEIVYVGPDCEPEVDALYPQCYCDEQLKRVEAGTASEEDMGITQWFSTVSDYMDAFWEKAREYMEAI